MNLYNDEPTFTLRAADVMAPWAIISWARSVIADPKASKPQFLKATEAIAVANQMLEWQTQNPDKVKLPDSVIVASKIVKP